MEPLHVTLVTPLSNRTGSTTKDAKMVNCYGELLGSGAARLISRPGYNAGTLYEAGVVQGITTYLGVARMVVDDKLYTTSTTSQAVTTGGLRVDFV